MDNPELKKLMWCGTPMLEEDDLDEVSMDNLKKLAPEIQEEVLNTIALIKEAKQSVRDGVYPDVITAMKAVGLNPKPIVRN